MQEKELITFIKENALLLYEYINCEILKDIGVISSGFFIRLVDEYFNKQKKRVSTDNLTSDTLAYYLITEVLGEAQQAFPFFRKDTMTLDLIFKDAKVYFNHVKFTIENNNFNIFLIQTKAGVSTLDEEIIKYSKQFPMKDSGLKEFIANNQDKELIENSKKLIEEINKVL